MSRIGKKPIPVPSGIKVFLNGNTIKVDGPKGSLSREISKGVSVEIGSGAIKVSNIGDSRDSKALYGLARSIIANMVKGVTDGFMKKLEISGVGYRADVQGSTLNLSLGYSHPVKYPLPKGITAEVEKQTLITLKGVDNQLLGLVASEVKMFRVPDPYKAKGIKYRGETILRKAGKAGKAAGGK
ncbi:MAG: 50S ribosomal protein L6 [Deltaproteobacteria bacterium GWC2_42_11]|nr:MAG: 50S ribosomal protein L6 [Deltaproteobacteria bacterium GWC2_42_11]HBO85235.1 50S ribosomal protein L6 [Deltaproteobacteria bacterium]